MTALREAAQQALEALETGGWNMTAAALRAALAQRDPQDPELSAALGWPGGISDPVLDRKTLLQQVAALRAALAQQDEPAQEQAFHGFMSDDGTQVDVCFSPSAPRRDGTYATAYYTAPPHRVAQQAEPLNLRDPAVQKRLATQWGYVPAAQAEPVEEPVYKVKVTSRWHDTEPLAPAFSLPDGEHLLYTAPPQRRPLTQEESDNIYREFTLYQDRLTPSVLQRIVRAIERAHGIKEN